MDKRTIVSDIKQSFDGASFLNVTEIAKYMGISRNTAPKFLEGLEYLQMGRERKYLVTDIAGMIIQQRRVD